MIKKQDFFIGISTALTCVDVDHKLDDLDATDIPDDVSEVVNFLVNEGVWQWWLFILLSLLQKPDEVQCDISETLVATVLILELVAFITFIEQIGTGDTAPDEECVVFTIELFFSLEQSFSGGITHTDGILVFLLRKFVDKLLNCLVFIVLSWFKHSPESLLQVFMISSLFLNAKIDHTKSLCFQV